MDRTSLSEDLTVPAPATTTRNGQALSGPRFSIAIPVRNDARWLAGAIESVLAQTYPNWELVIGDNASTDDIADVLAPYRDSRVRYHFFEKEVGLAANHNRTISLCVNDWVQTMGADDRLLPHCLERMVERAERAARQGNPLVSIVGACERVDAQGQPADIGHLDRVRYRPVPIQCIPDGVYSGTSWLRVNAAPGVMPWMMGSVAMSREMLTEIGGFRAEMELCGDLELVLRLGAYGPVAYIDEPLMRYTVRDDSSTHEELREHVKRHRSMVQSGSAWLSAIQTHELFRPVGRGERAVIYAAIARSFLQRALRHRTERVGQGRWGSVLDVMRAIRFSPAAVLGSWRVLVALAAIFAPSSTLKRASTLSHRFGVVVI